ncbi:MAG: hypothetical protein U9M92_03240 [Patescibacteria group bacterium]|nr:hypothetical protein [Patescibacteria group bacterium]
MSKKTWWVIGIIVVILIIWWVASAPQPVDTPEGAISGQEALSFRTSLRSVLIRLVPSLGRRIKTEAEKIDDCVDDCNDDLGDCLDRAKNKYKKCTNGGGPGDELYDNLHDCIEDVNDQYEDSVKQCDETFQRNGDQDAYDECMEWADSFHEGQTQECRDRYDNTDTNRCIDDYNEARSLCAAAYNACRATCY